MTQHKGNQGSFMGIVLIIIGLIFLLNTFTNWSFGYLLADWWPLIFIVIAIVKFQNQERSGGLMFLTLGAVFLLFTNDILEWGVIWRLWPAILIFIGLSLIFKGRNGGWGFVNNAALDNDFVQSNAIFSGAEHRITSQNFKGGETMALFGGVELDLRDAKLSPDGCKINATAIFGAVEITVPSDWKVVVSGTPIFGGVDNKSRGQSEDADKIIQLHCTVVFGGIEIK